MKILVCSFAIFNTGHTKNDMEQYEHAWLLDGSRNGSEKVMLMCCVLGFEMVYIQIFQLQILYRNIWDLGLIVKHVCQLQTANKELMILVNLRDECDWSNSRSDSSVLVHFSKPRRLASTGFGRGCTPTVGGVRVLRKK